MAAAGQEGSSHGPMDSEQSSQQPALPAHSVYIYGGFTGTSVEGDMLRISAEVGTRGYLHAILFWAPHQ